MIKQTEENEEIQNAQQQEIEKKLAALTAALEEAKGKKILDAEKKQPLWKRICGSVIWTFLCISFAIILIIAVTGMIAKAKGDKAEFLGFGIFVVVTGSMEPEIKVGDIIVTKKTAQDKIKAGDDITFQSGDKVITHRVKTVTERGYITYGINNNGAEDGEVLYSKVYGKVIFKSTFMGNVYKLVSDSYGFLFVIVVPLFLFVVYEGWSLGRKFKALKNAEEDEGAAEDKGDEKPVSR